MQKYPYNRIRIVKCLILALLVSAIFFIFFLIYLWVNSIYSKRALQVANAAEYDELHCKYTSAFGYKKACAQLDNCYFVNSADFSNFRAPSRPYILISCTDHSIPDGVNDFAEKILTDSNLIKWFTTNVVKEDPKLHAIPLGIDYHRVRIQPDPNIGPIESPVAQDAYIRNLPQRPFYERKIKIYVNFLHALRGKYGVIERVLAIQQIPSELMVSEATFVPRKDSWKKILQYAFVLSPAGNGLDCHRTWEALALGAIPIVKTSPLDTLYDDLPVLIVQEWSDITPELLTETVAKFKAKDFNYQKLALAYWLDYIRE